MPTFLRDSCYRISHYHRDEQKNEISTDKVKRKIKMGFQNKTISSNMNDKKKEVELVTSSVFYVESRKAKSLKNALEQQSLLDKNYRITKAKPDSPVDDPAKYVAVPVVKEIWDKVSSKSIDDSSCGWLSLVSGIGKQEVMYSSVTIGKMKASNKNSIR